MRLPTERTAAMASAVGKVNASPAPAETASLKRERSAMMGTSSLAMDAKTIARSAAQKTPIALTTIAAPSASAASR